MYQPIQLKTKSPSLRNSISRSLIALITLLLAAIGSAQSVHATVSESPDPSWVTTGNLVTARYNHTATLLSSGKVLVAGGQGSSGILSSAELYDPATGRWSSTGSFTEYLFRVNHTATLLPNGKVLVAGGNSESFLTENAELYDPATGSWSISGRLNFRREKHTATLLPNGKVLVAGGYDAYIGSYLASAELYDPATRRWSTTGGLNFGREKHTATLLPSGKVLVAGGDNGSYLSSAELYDPIR